MCLVQNTNALMVVGTSDLNKNWCLDPLGKGSCNLKHAVGFRHSSNECWADEATRDML